MKKINNFYIKEDRSKKIKEVFKSAYHFVKKKIKKNKNLKIADFGCATGDFEYYLRKQIKNEIYGFDIDHKFIETAKKKVKDVDFKKSNILKKDIKLKKKFDITFSIGTSCHFTSIDKYLENLIFYTKDKGIVIIQTIFNDYDLDVLIKHKYPDDNFKSWHSDWNFFSKTSVKKILKKNSRVNSFFFRDFKFNKILKKRKEPIRSWTVDLNGKKALMNGLMIIQNQSFLIIKVK